MRENLVEVARLVRLGLRQGLRFEVGETIGVAIATLVKHFPHQLHQLFLVGLDHACVELAIGAGFQVTFRCYILVSPLVFDGLAVGVIKAVHELLLVLDRHLPAVHDQSQ